MPFQVNQSKYIVETEGIWPAELNQQQMGSGTKAVASVDSHKDDAALLSNSSTWWCNPAFKFLAQIIGQWKVRRMESGNSRGRQSFTTQKHILWWYKSQYNIILKHSNLSVTKEYLMARISPCIQNNNTIFAMVTVSCYHHKRKWQGVGQFHKSHSHQYPQAKSNGKHHRATGCLAPFLWLSTCN